LLTLLADMGVSGGDDRRIEVLLDAFLKHERDGRFLCLAKWRQMPQPLWGTLPCDTHVIADALVRYARAGDPIVRRSLDRIAADLIETTQGLGWRCLPDPVVKFRGPGRVADVCLVVTLEALRLFARLYDERALDRGPATAPTDGSAKSAQHIAGGVRAECAAAARTALRAWRMRGSEKPYMFGHGRSFKTVKWPTSWYDIHLMLDAVGRYPEIWSAGSATATEEDRRAVAEMVACLVAYNVAKDGTVTPQSCYKGVEGLSFGQKKRPSPFATARVLAVLRSFVELADEIAAVDVVTLPSSKGGTGMARPPRLAGRA
jgi:hypothetical protein